MTWIKELTLDQVEAAFDDIWEDINSSNTMPTSKPDSVITGSYWLDEETGKINVYQNGAWETYSKD